MAHGFSGNNYGTVETGMTSGNFPYPAYEALRSDRRAFSQVFAFNRAGRLNVQIRGQADLGTGLSVSGRFFGALGVPPAAGRLIDDSDDRPGAPAVAALSYAYARRRFGKASRAVGQAMQINNIPFMIVGVAAPGFYGVDTGETVDVYLALRADPLRDGNADQWQNANYYWVQTMGRLRPGVSLSQAQSALAPVFRQFASGTAANDEERKDLPALLLKAGGTGLERLRQRYSMPLFVLMALVGLILAIACANLANLLLVRAAARRKEMAVRLSLGAGRPRVVRQLLTESVLLACMGGALGVLFASWGIRFLTALVSDGRENFTMRAELDWNVLAVALALSLATGVLFGLAPALRATRVDLTSDLKETRAGQAALRARRSILHVSLGQILVVSQIAVSVLLLVAAGLFVRTLAKLDSIQLGFNREHLLLFNVNARQAGYKGEELARFYQALQTRINAIPGVRSGSASNYALVSQSTSSTIIALDHQVLDKKQGTSYVAVGPGFLATMQIPILFGRDISDRDVASGAKVAVVNQKFAKNYFGDENPLGRHFGLGRNADLEIVGVTPDSRYSSLKQDIPELAYIPYTHDLRWLYGLTYEIRAAGDPMGLAGAVRRILQEADSRIPLSNVTTQDRVIDQTIGQERTFAMLSASLAILAVLIACVGLYGTMAYNVARRTGELGIRMALGAARPRLLWMILREALALTAAGLAIGLPVALATSHVVKSFLFDLKPNDPLSLMLAGAVLLLVAVAARLCARLTRDAHRPHASVAVRVTSRYPTIANRFMMSARVRSTKPNMYSAIGRAGFSTSGVRSIAKQRPVSSSTPCEAK